MVFPLHPTLSGVAGRHGQPGCDTTLQTGVWTVITAGCGPSVFCFSVRGSAWCYCPPGPCIAMKTGRGEGWERFYTTYCRMKLSEAHGFKEELELKPLTLIPLHEDDCMVTDTGLFSQAYSCNMSSISHYSLLHFMCMVWPDALQVTS